MEISEIKSHLTIADLLNYYRLKADKNARLICPFHEDNTPSLQIYYKTQTAYCFAGSCKTHGKSMDVIDFIMAKENLTKHEALKKASQLATAEPKSPSITNQPIAQTETKEAASSYFERKIIDHHKGKGFEYLQKRGLDMSLLKAKEAIKIGYNGQIGDPMKNCVLFPLRESAGEIVSLYGRSIFEIKDAKHYYSAGRKGLFPSYPKAETKHLVLAESIIDACTLLQYTNHSVLAIYGTNGLTPDHLEAIKGLENLEEITLFFDGDEAGRKALITVSHQIKAVKEVKISYVQTPDNEDINSLITSHEPEILNHLIENRSQNPAETFFLSIEEKEPEIIQPKIEITDQQTPPSGRSDVSAGGLKIISPELLIFTDNGIKISILGGVKLTGMDKLRATIKAEKEGINLPVRHNLDLYHAQQLESLQAKITDNLQIESREVGQILENLISNLERYRAKRLEALQPKKSALYKLTEQEKHEAINYLKAPDLIKRTGESIAQSGIIGEENSALIAFLIYTSRKRAVPLHLMCLGASATGKTYLQEKIGELMPMEEKIEITTLSENAFYYFGQEELKHKLILIEDLDGASDVLYPLRELQSKRKITKTVTLKDSKGNLKTVTLTVEGPVSVSGCTTREKLYEDNANRCILIEIDTSQSQDKLIMDYQRKLSAGLINKASEQKTKVLIQNAQRILRPIEVRNPYATLINLPEVIFKPRRTIGLLLAFIETITFYHQYQLPTKTDPNTGENYIETQPEHIQIAFKLLLEVLFRKSDELSGACRKFLEHLKLELKTEKQSSFTAKEIRKTMRMNPSNLKRYLIELDRYGYIKGKGNRYRGYEYNVVDMAEYEQLTNSIQLDLEAIMSKIKSSGLISSPLAK